MIWWVDQSIRVQSERTTISDLEERNTWLTNIKWHVVSNLRLAADFDLQVAERLIPLTITYPEYFPDVPPSVVPRDGKRLSDHQYGEAGELCLQFRSDNWTPEITGAMMIESAYRLLLSEQETGEPAPSEHRVLPAQRARNAVFRFLYSPRVFEGLLMVEEGQVVDAEIQEHLYAGAFAAQLTRIGPVDDSMWIAPNRRGYGASTVATKIIRVPEGASVAYDNLDELVSLLESHNFESVLPELLQVSGPLGLILFNGTNHQVSMAYGASDNRKLVNYDKIIVDIDRVRLTPEFARLKTAKVAIVGCGSVGSKVAVHLARSGVGQFVLVDGDLLASGNLVRNELDWRAVGMHKSQALAARLKEVNAECEVISRTTVLGGQESGGATSATMRYIAESDLIIDATADPVVFNLCASISRRAKKPICWAQVFGGGAGGIVVRLRPGIDPTPLTARQRIENWYSEQGIAWPESEISQPYSQLDASGEPLIADDADVSVIAAHLSRYATDLLVRPNSTIFPYSVYLIGMTDSWIFTAPFDVRPIDLGESDGWDIEVQPGDPEAYQQLLADLFPGENDAG